MASLGRPLPRPSSGLPPLLIKHKALTRRAELVRPVLQALLIEIATSWVGGKLGAELDARYKLPKMRYKGEVVEPQRIRADDK